MHHLQWVLNAMGLHEISQGENAEQSQGSQAFRDRQGTESTEETQREWPEKTSRCPWSQEVSSEQTTGVAAKLGMTQGTKCMCNHECFEQELLSEAEGLKP